MPHVQISPATVTRLRRERPIAAAQRLTPDSSARGGDLIVLDRRRRLRPLVAASRAVRVLLAESEKLVRAGFRVVLEQEADITVVAEASSGRAAVALASELRPDVVVMNVRLPGVDGIEATRQIIARSEPGEVEVLVVGDDEPAEDLFAALRAGASGFLTMETEPDELAHAVRVLAGGGVQLSPSGTRRLIDELASQLAPRRSTPELFEELSTREREVVALAALGLNDQEIAERLVVSPATAKTHVSRSMLKLRARNRAKLVALAYQTGFAERPPARNADIRFQGAGR